MSHFSKIKTNITSLSILIKTIKQLGFNYRFSNCFNNLNFISNVVVYKLSKYGNEDTVFTFIWNIKEYILLVDLDLWNLDIDFHYLFDHLLQQYAYNVVMSTSYISGFQKIKESSYCDGSIKLILQRWSNI
uniref:Uncharacterized protein ycf35 n=1 Tax=Periphykon beckeri TaxID=2006982 RepID=A0A1Z1M372_9FLOR|nr:hypothetical protein [Periphykon beckeri]ARW60330.1 hypothetical protein [Periphykon beckeri]